MKQIFLLSKENLKLAEEEVLALAENKKHELYENILILNTNNNLSDRLAYAHKIYRFIFECNYTDLIKNMERFDWQSVYKKDFCLRIDILNENHAIGLCLKQRKFKSANINLNQLKQADIMGKGLKSKSIIIENKNKLEKELAGYIWRKIKKPKVNLTNPKTRIDLFFTKDKVICGLLLSEIKKDFIKRKAHLRPGFSPVSLHPRLAKALVNLTGIKKGETLLDPFCGTGGILIEAGLMGIKCVGMDIDDNMLKKASNNMKFFKIKNVKLLKHDATKINNKYKYIVTDLPYGKNSKNTDLKKLYADFIINLKKILIKKAIVIFPDFINYKKLTKNALHFPSNKLFYNSYTIKNLKIEKEFSYYIHRSLSKRIVVLKLNTSL